MKTSCLHTRQRIGGERFILRLRESVQSLWVYKIPNFVLHFFFLSSGICSIGDAFAETPAPTLGPASAIVTVEAKPLEVKDLVPALESTGEFLRMLPKGIEDNERVRVILEALPKAKERVIDDLSRRVQPDLLSRRPLKQLLDFETVLKDERIRFENWSGEVSAAIQLLAESKSGIAERSLMIRQGVDLLAKDMSTKVLQSRVQETLQNLEKANRSIQAQLDKLLLLQTDVLSLSESLQKLIGMVQVAQRAVQSQLLVHDAMPFFGGEYFPSIPGTSPAITIHPFVELSVLQEYIRELDNSRLYVYLAFLVGLVWCLVRIHRTATLIPPVRMVRERPYAIFSLGFLLIAWLLFQDAPSRVLTLIQTVLVIPIAFLTDRLLRGQYRGTTIGIAVLFVVDSLDEFLRPFPSLKSLTLFVELVCLALFMLRVGRMLHQNFPERSFFSRIRVFRFACLGVSSGSIIAAFALIIGYWRLGIFLGQGLLDAAYLGASAFVLFSLLSETIAQSLILPGFDRLQSLRVHFQTVTSVLRSWIFIILFFSWLFVSLRIFGVQESVWEMLKQSLAFSIQLGEFTLSFGGILLFLLILYFGTKFSRVATAVVELDVYPRSSLDRGIQHAISSGIYYLILLLSLLAGLAAFGVSPQSLALFAGAISVGVGFGLQHIVNNLVSGMILLWERPIRVGDLIAVGGVTGTVSKIALRSTILRTGEDAEIIIPNSKIIGEQLTNWTHTSTLGKVVVSLTTAHDANIEAAMEALLNAAVSVERFLKSPKPEVQFKGFKEQGCEFQVSGWIGDVAMRGSVENDLQIALAREMQRAQIPLARPIREITLKGYPILETQKS